MEEIRGIKPSLMRYFINTVPVNEDASLCFRRESVNSSSRIYVYYIDDTTHTQTTLAIIHGGKWNFTTKENSSLFWSYAKKHGAVIRRVIRDLRKDWDDLQGVSTEIKCLGRRVRIESWKAGKTVRNFVRLPKIKII